MENCIFSSVITSSLEKALVGTLPKAYPELKNANALIGERYSFQLLTLADYYTREIPLFTLEICGDDVADITVREVKQVHADYPHYGCDPSVGTKLYIDSPSALYPEILEPMDETRFHLAPGQLKAFWFEYIPKTAGEKNVTVKVKYGEETVTENSLTVSVIDASQPEQKLVYTNWFHCDCLASWYNVPVFSEKHWEIIENYMRAASRGGINCILTPVFTPPLDTEVGSERPTVQLVGIKRTNGVYSFDFSLLKRWIDTAHRSGITHFEISHFFTQWGARNAPKVMAETEEGYRRIFGWETDGTGEEYSAFITAFLSELVPFLKAEGVIDNCYFHVSDEPSEEHLEGYLKAKNIIKPYIGQYKQIDALSSVKFYQNGAVQIPVPATNRIESFLAEDIGERWAYYCCGQYNKVSNRFIAYPSFRNRIIGVMLYKFGIKGFLHWGFNFYYSMGSRRLINPFVTQSGDAMVPSGDAFVVYPGENGKPIESVRYEVFYEAVQDYGALQLAEEKVGREKVLEVIKEVLGDVTFSEYPTSAAPILELRNKICEIIKG
ncbi:MAG: DUF4091 domain-containing protein [Firmicutes bacterium]|nr:DUF4091 domain-containing protein [Candidatus Colimorpha enterica]